LADLSANCLFLHVICTQAESLEGIESIYACRLGWTSASSVRSCLCGVFGRI